MFFMIQVVPFTPSAGVLEWVNGTVPLGEYLIGRLVELHSLQSSQASYVRHMDIKIGITCFIQYEKWRSPWALRKWRLDIPKMSAAHDYGKWHRALFLLLAIPIFDTFKRLLELFLIAVYVTTSQMIV